MTNFPSVAGGSDKVMPLLRDRGERSNGLGAIRAVPVLPAHITDGATALDHVADLGAADLGPDVTPLPALASPADIRELIRYLYRKQTGVSVVEAMAATRKNTLHPGKLSAYEFLGLIERQGDRLKLSARGQAFARKLQPEAVAFRELILGASAWRGLLSWVFTERLELITQTDVAAYWTSFFPELVDLKNDRDVTASVVCFFQLCQAAELGALTIGKRGQPARLRVDMAELEICLRQMADSSPDTGEPLDSPPRGAGTPPRISGPVPVASLPAPLPAFIWTRARFRVLVSCAGGETVARRIGEALDLCEMDSEIHQRDSAAGGMLSDALVGAMHRCQAAIIILSGELSPGLSGPLADGAGQGMATQLRQAELLEISSAFVLYQGRVLLLRDQRVEIPPEFNRLPQCDFAGPEPDWETGLRVLREMRELRKDVR
ncbi:MAG: hypothetical protein ACKV2V_25220 [Blastocatellia bacterium]